MSTKRTAAPETTPQTPDFGEVVNLLAVLSEATNRLEDIAAIANGELLEIIDGHKAEYARLQQAATEAETALEQICRAHPEWFTAVKTIKTPYGKVSFRTGTSLEIRDDEATVKLLRAEAARSVAQRGADGRSEIFNAADFIRTVEVPNLEALEKLDDSTLGKFLVKRVSADKFSATPAKVDFGKAVKEAAQKNN